MNSEILPDAKYVRARLVEAGSRHVRQHKKLSSTHVMACPYNRLKATHGTIMTNHSDPESLKTYYLEHFRANQTAILDAATLGFDAPNKGCPGWDVACLTAHMGRVYTFWLKWIRERPRAYSREAYQEILADRDVRFPGYNAWESAGFPRASRPDGIMRFAKEAGDELDSMLADLQPDESVWTFVPAHKTGAFVFRRLAMETTIHRWDAQEAQGIAPVMDAELARDGIDEMLMMFREDPGYEEETKTERHGQKILLREQPGPRRWSVTFSPDGMKVSNEDGPQEATVSGTASDLWLFIMGRRNSSEVDLEGDSRLADRWGDLAGRF